MPPRVHTADLLVLGSGQGGTALAGAMSDRGARVTLAERGDLGGSCVNHGCIPSKTLLAAARAIGEAQRAIELGVSMRTKVDGELVFERVRRIRDEWREGVGRIEDKENVTVVDGEARFVDAETVDVDGELWTAPRIVINTGRRAMLPPIDGIDAVDVLTDANVFDLDRPPRSVVVLGGGYIGIELGQALHRLGSEVTILEREDRILSEEDPRVSEVLTEALRADGLVVRTNAEASAMSSSRTRVQIQLNDGSMLETERVLVAAGRTPNTDALDTDRADIELDDRGFVVVDDRFHSSNERVWAIGDVIDQPAFTHVSYEDHKRLLSIWDGGDRRRADRTLAYAIFTDPQVGRVGPSRDSLEQRGHDVMVVEEDAASIGRARVANQTTGFYRVLADRSNGRLLGATFVSPDAAELVQSLLVPIDRGMTWSEYAESVHIHPTYGESIQGLVRRFASKIDDDSSD